ncbi:MAG TPA: peptidoglycan endopeptidase, partial [Sphingomonas sp.]
MSAGERAAAAAQGAVGAKFRLHGRDAATGLDCVGLAALAMRAGGSGATVPSGYGLRGGDVARVAAVVEASMARCDGGRAGDLLLFGTGPGQLHLGVRTAAGFVHADAG